MKTSNRPCLCRASFICPLAASVLLFALTLAGVRARSQTGSQDGKITDAGGAPLSGAIVGIKFKL